VVDDQNGYLGFNDPTVLRASIIADATVCSKKPSIGRVSNEVGFRSGGNLAGSVRVTNFCGFLKQYINTVY